MERYLLYIDSGWVQSSRPPDWRAGQTWNLFNRSREEKNMIALLPPAVAVTRARARGDPEA